MCPPRWLSLDAWGLAQPSRAFCYIASHPAGAGAWVALRRPAFIACVLGCVVSLAATGVLTARIAISAAVYWAHVPLIELAAVVLVLGRRVHATSRASVIDAFFIGHAPWTLFLLAIAAILAAAPPALAWRLLTTVCLALLVVVVLWSACLDFCFYRFVAGAGRLAAIRDLLIQRLLTWVPIVGIFAIEDLRPSGIGREIVEALAEVFPR